MSAGSTAAPSPKDGLFFLAILMNMRNKPEVDWDLVAQLTGYTNAHCAATRFGQLKKKYASRTSSTPNIQSPSGSFGSTSTIPNSPTRSPSKGSPSKRAKKEARGGINMSSGRVKKTPVKGSDAGLPPSAKARGSGMDAEDNVEGGDVFVHGNKGSINYQEGNYGGEWMGDEY